MVFGTTELHSKLSAHGHKTLPLVSAKYRKSITLKPPLNYKLSTKIDFPIKFSLQFSVIFLLFKRHRKMYKCQVEYFTVNMTCNGKYEK